MGVRAPQHSPMEHAGEVDVVDVVALSPDEAGIFFADHAAEADGVGLLC